ncbi:dTDP-glucose 4,6-dehydratase [Terriglobus roseus]|uniref:dTDP-glucose 4,6-dehydratase n=1 Tax=Terriglobus roseus TaxID=392734 RepID=A0A1H4L7P0_9BACT|nr:dTDP-glucose 4,6-dehydratase [Terriglobus roseus]SEB66754.1 dTDP-glucose 4,6-dehydratase [Terriglobus roseus]
MKTTLDSPLLVTGGAGFIGSNFVLRHLRDAGASGVVTLDALTYAGNPHNLDSLLGDARHTLVHGDILDRDLVASLLEKHRPRAIVHFAAESHVDRSILGPGAFLKTNIDGTFVLLECAREYFATLSGAERENFRFLHVSTDEVYGTLTPDAPAFHEDTPFAPNSPYAASKAASDHLVRAWTHTYGLPTLITNCSNNYGPYQFPEKLIPLVINNALAGKPLPVYGDGMQVRDWLFVEDHCSAIETVLANGRLGETYNVGGNNQQTNISVVKTICALLDEFKPKATSYTDQITYVTDRPGHDRRYAIDARKIQRELNWFPAQDFVNGLRLTVRWYLDNQPWVENVTSGAYREWMDTNYSARTEEASA